ncbi:hypothetical protein D3C72_938830 [compost metagenome]
MHQAEEVLLVEVVQLAVVVLQQQLLAGLVIGAGEVEVVAVAALGAAAVGPGDAQGAQVGGVAPAGVLQLAGGQGEVADVVGGQLGAFIGQRQQAGVVGHHHRQLGLQSAVAQLATGNAHLCRQAQAAECADRRAIVLQRENRTGLPFDVGLAGLAAAIQANPQKPLGVDAEAHRSLGVA